MFVLVFRGNNFLSLSSRGFFKASLHRDKCTITHSWFTSNFNDQLCLKSHVKDALPLEFEANYECANAYLFLHKIEA